jgi:DNA-binding transcriptional regulator GbsR (MarR family)
MEDIDSKFLELYQKIGNMQGMNSLFTRIFSILYIEPDEISMDEVAEKTGYSLASISNSIKMLETMGLVRKSRHPGTKKIFLYMEKDFNKLIKLFMIKKQENIISLVKSEVPSIIKESKPTSEKSKKKLKILENYYKQILGFEKIVKKIIDMMDKL